MPELTWIGKQAVVKHHAEVPFRLLEEVPELSCPPAEGDTENLIVQGDNLTALKALLPRYAGQVKCIYIDPPYNTGNEGWVYNDAVNSPEIRQWLGHAVGKEAEDLSRHDKWLCMMYPRLMLLKGFLHEKGAIFVSIDDEEVHHLRAIMDEIFGVSKRLATFVWRTDGNFDNQAKVKNCHEYVLAYASSPDAYEHPKVIDPAVGQNSKLRRDFIRNTIVKNGPKNPISAVLLPAGFPADLDEARIHARTNAWPHYESDLVIRGGRLENAVSAISGWSSRDLLVEFIDSGFQPVKDSKGQATRFVLTRTGAIELIKGREHASHVITVLSGVGSTQTQSAELAQMGFKFPFPKPVDLVSYIVSLQNDKDCLVLDSFAGSGTTGHAVLDLNNKDGGNRRFILVEILENIARDTTRERVARAAQGYKNVKSEAVPALGGGFQFARLGKPLFDETGAIREDVKFGELAEFVFFKETGRPLPKGRDGALRRPSGSERKGNGAPGGRALPTPLLGVHEGRAVYLLFNGILGDKTVNGGNVLTGPVLAKLPPHDGPKVIYAAACRLGRARQDAEQIKFKQTPYDLHVP
ncbi:MAG: site-specific DNA-methyltransferase [Verrucomicrobia bacterium]|nr:site-specific DNA-methyltransferase [Verrucomicrobiota bacterium]